MLLLAAWKAAVPFWSIVAGWLQAQAVLKMQSSQDCQGTVLQQWSAKCLVVQFILASVAPETVHCLSELYVFSLFQKCGYKYCVSGLLLWTFFLPIHRASFSTTQVQNTHLRCQLVIAYPALCILSCAALRHRPPSALSASSLHLSCSSEKPPSCFLQCHIWQEELYLKVTKTDNFSHSQSSHSTLLCQQQAGRCETAATWRVPAKLKGEAAEWQNCPCPPFFAHVSTVLLPREDWGVEGERALPAGAGLIPAEPLCSSSSSRGKAAPAQLLSFKEGVSS